MPARENGCVKDCAPIARRKFETGVDEGCGMWVEVSASRPLTLIQVPTRHRAAGLDAGVWSHVGDRRDRHEL
jgi:hypothetical protein